MNSTLYLIFFLLFVLGAAIERGRATFATKRSPISGRKWVTVLPVITYVGIVVLSVADIFLMAEEIDFFVGFSGAVIYACGLFLRRSAMALFGEAWNIHIDAKKGQNLVKEGPYGYIVHPYYTAVLLELTGVALLANSYIALIAVFAVQYPLLVLRANLEEKELVNKFGKEYLEYKKKKITIFPVRSVQ